MGSHEFVIPSTSLLSAQAPRGIWSVKLVKPRFGVYPERSEGPAQNDKQLKSEGTPQCEASRSAGKTQRAANL